MGLTLQPGTLVVASAYPDPPFDLMENGSATGFDIELMRAICAQLGLTLQPVPYSGDDFITASPPHWTTWRQERSAWSSSSFR